MVGGGLVGGGFAPRWIGSIAVTGGDGVTAISSEGSGGYPDARGGLAALEFGLAHQLGDTLDGGAVEAALHDVFDRLFLFDESFEDGVQHRIGWQ